VTGPHDPKFAPFGPAGLARAAAHLADEAETTGDLSRGAAVPIVMFVWTCAACGDEFFPGQEPYCDRASNGVCQWVVPRTSPIAAKCSAYGFVPKTCHYAGIELPGLLCPHVWEQSR